MSNLTRRDFVKALSLCGLGIGTMVLTGCSGDSNRYVTADDYYKVKDGMTYSQVVSAFGTKPDISDIGTVKGETCITCLWYNRSRTGYIGVIFNSKGYYVYKARKGTW